MGPAEIKAAMAEMEELGLALSPSTYVAVVK
jgi:hypothetical protein